MEKEDDGKTANETKGKELNGETEKRLFFLLVQGEKPKNANGTLFRMNFKTQLS
jgi:hypothetical protein